MTTTAEATAGLKKWIQNHDDHVTGAVQLLIEHDHWLRDPAFLKAAVAKASDGDVWINWRGAREAFTAGQFNRASSTELAVLDLAIALGSDQFRFSQLGLANTRIVARAVNTALGLQHYGGRQL